MNETHIVAAILDDRKTWEKVRPYLMEYLPSSHLQVVLKEIERYYQNDKAAKNCERGSIEAAILRGLANPKHRDIFRQLFASLPPKAEVSLPNVETELLDCAKEVKAAALAQALLNKDTKAQERLLVDYRGLLEEGLKQHEAPFIVHTNPKTSTLVEGHGQHKIPLAPLSLNTATGGGLVGGDSVLVFARPEVGKTAFALSVVRLAAKYGHKVLYCTNEDAIQRLVLRAKASFSGMDYEEVIKDNERADSLADSAGFGNVVFVEMYPGSLSQLNELVKTYQPELVIIDQMINLASHQSDNRVLELGAIARGIRDLGKHYKCATVSFAQAGESAEGKLVLDLSDLNWSKTDVQAAADLMVGIGTNPQFNTSDRRMLSLPKNKLSGIHSYFPVKIDRFKSQVTSMES